MTPIEAGAGGPFRTEDFSAGTGGDVHRYYFFFDPTTGKFLSSHTETLSCGRVGAPGTGFQRMANANTMTSTFGYGVIHESTLITLCATATNVPTSTSIVIYNNGASVLTETWDNGTGVLQLTENLDLDVGNISVEITTTGTGPTNPEVQLGWKWRLD